MDAFDGIPSPLSVNATRNPKSSGQKRNSVAPYLQRKAQKEGSLFLDWLDVDDHWWRWFVDLAIGTEIMYVTAEEGPWLSDDR